MNELRQILFRHMISSGSFRSAHCFLSFLPATATTNRLSLRACTGQTAVQRMQVMQRISSVSMGCFRGMAFTGQTAAHLPHRVHCFPACGWTSRPPKGRRSVFSGMGTGGSSLCASLSRITAPNCASLCASSSSGLPGGNLGDDAVLSDSADSRNGEISCFTRRIPQFGKRIPIRPIAVCAQQNGARTAAARLRQAGQRNLRNAPAEAGHRNQADIFFGKPRALLSVQRSERSMVSNRSEIAADNSPAALRTPPVGLKTS